MNPPKNQAVQVRFHNDIFFDAIVESWSDEKTVLRLPKSDDIVVIQETLKNVLLVRFINQKEEIAPDKKELLNQFENLKEQPKDKETIKNIAELKKQLNELEREELQAKINSLQGTGIRQINYGIPLTGITISPPEKITSKNNGVNSGLSGLFKKRH